MTRTRATTIGDVARAAKVSVGTVSHVLSGKREVSKELRLRVEGTIRTLGYVPNIHAQGLKKSRSGVIGLCLPHGSTSYMNELANELEAVARRADYSVVHVFGRQDSEIELQRARDLLRFRVDGLILFPSSHPEPALDFLRAQKLPTVLMDRSNGDPSFDQVTLDNAQAMQDAAEHLIEIGHRRILFIYMSGQYGVTIERISGLNRACDAAGTEVVASQLEYFGIEETFREAVLAALAGDTPPTAIIVSNSQQAAMLITTLREAGVRIPHDVSVVSFDETEWSQLVSPPLATIRQPAKSLVRTAWQLLSERIEAPEAPARNMLMRATFIARESVAPPKTAPPAKRD